MIFDTHAHYNLPPLQNQWQQLWRQAQNKGVAKTNIVGTDVSSSTTAIKIAKSNPNLYATIGIHPSECQPLAHTQQIEFVKNQISSLNSLLKHDSNKNIIAIGEIGLDYFWLKKELANNKINSDQFTSTIDTQKKLLEAQLKLSSLHQLPIVLHVRDIEKPEKPTQNNAYWDLLAVLNGINFKHIVFHCVSGPLTYIKQAIKLDAYFGFDGNITYPNADNIRKIFQLIPQDRILLETDAPYLPPQKFRGQTCLPEMISDTSEYLKSEIQADLMQIYQNSLECFEIS